MNTFSQNTRKTYSDQWEKSEKHAEESLPKSAITEVEAILEQATKDKNIPQMMKAYVYLSSLNQTIDDDNDYDFAAKLEQLAIDAKSATDKALIHSILADIYLQSYLANRWDINQRTNLADDIIPSDIKEWTVNNYINQISEHLESAVKEKDALKKDTSKSYDDIINLGEDSRTYQPALYDFVMNRAIETAKSLREIGYEEFDLTTIGASLDQLLKPAQDYVNINITTTKKYIAFNYFQQYFKDLQSRGLTNSVVLLELNKYNYLKNLANNFYKDKKLETLYALEKQYATVETTAEIINEITNELSNDNYYSNRRWQPTPDDGNEGDKNINQKIYNWLQKGIDKYPNYKRINILENKLANIQAPSMHIEGNNLFYNNDQIEFDVIYRNPQLAKGDKNVKLYKVENGKATLINTLPLNFESKTTYNADLTKLKLEQLPFGEYYLSSEELSDKDNKTKFSFSISNLFTYHRNNGENEYEVFVVNRKNGKPVEGATVTLFRYNKDDNKQRDIITTLTTDKTGLATYKDSEAQKNQYYYLVANYTVAHGKDNGLQEQSIYNNSYNYRSYTPSVEEQNRNTISLFIDRSIYRPSQTIYYKAIVMDKNSKVVNNSKQTVKLFNPNGEVVAEKALITNEYGSVAGEFVLPQGGLLGYYRIEIEDNTSVGFSVEEYKRPTFEVKFDKIEKTYSFGDKITLKGNAKTFSGISLQDANVNYRISRRPFSFWFWNRSNESHYQDGTVKTKDDGTFEIEFIPETGDGHKLFGRDIYTFEVTADITDLNGETQSNTYSISIGEVSMLLHVEMPDKIEKSKELKITIGAKNLDGADIQSAGTYNIYTIDKNNSIQTKVLEGEFKTGAQDEIAKRIKTLATGQYRIKVKAKDDNAKEVSAQSDFIVYSYNDKRPPYETDLWLVEKETTFKGNKPVEIIYGTSNEDVYILYQLYNNQNTFERKFIKLNNENQTFKIPYQAVFGEEVYVSFTSVKDGELKTNSILLKKEQEVINSKLKIKLDVFRDKLLPGQEETWTLSVSDSQDKTVSAELLASMYDISLDQIMPYTTWILNRPYIYKDYLRTLNFNYTTVNKQTYSIDLKYTQKYLRTSNFKFDKFKYSPSDLYGYGNSKRMYKVGSVNSSMIMQDQISIADVKEEETADGRDIAEFNSTDDMLMLSESIVQASPQAAGGTINQEKADQATPQIRSNFNETAFFFPQLKTNEKGETVVTFTVPESNTTWRFRAFAHDKDSKVGELERMVVTRKELMITPNMPRFVRQGDKTSISTKISNLSENSISGKVRIEFFNPIDEKIIDLKVNDVEQQFSLQKEASSSATWTFDIPNNIDMMGVRIVAQSEYFSDGEQHTLAVLPNRMLVTETMPFDVTKKGEQTFVFDKMVNSKSNTLDNYKLTLECASNPAWYAVQALPTLSNPTNNNAIDWFASYYVTTLGESLMQQYPKVANMIKAWKAAGGNKETLVSKLNKNQELKTILLEETPWVMDAKSETEQMERLSLLFDLNNTKQQKELALTKLEELLTDHNAWSWYDGMYPNRGLTQYILFGFANLQRVGRLEHPQKVKEMQITVLKYVDEQIVKDFENLKKYNTKWKEIKNISTMQLEYLYTRAMYRDIPITQEAREAERFYTDIVSKNWTNLNLYEKSLLAVLSKELGEKELANKIVKSIREHAVESKELGMYWPNNKNNVFLSMSAVCSHVFMMEALKANRATTEEMDMMKRWLVKQKQTQVWENTNATIHAISILLQEGSNWFENNSTPTIKVGKQTIEPNKQELGTGYFKTSWAASEIKQDMAKVSVTSEDAKPAYGSLYWQYYEDLDKITKQDGALNVNKELYKEVVKETGKILEKITETSPLQIGDKVIVRLVVRTDRDMEFVQLKDMRASCFEPIETISGVKWQNSVLYYSTTKDASTNFFFDVLPKGTYVFEYPVYANRSGEYSNGITSIQCAYAPEFTAHTAGIKVMIK